MVRVNVKLGIAILIGVAALGQQNLSSPVTVKPSPGASGELRWQETGGAYYVSLIAPTGMAANESMTWPAANASGVLTNNGSGTLSWSSSASGCPSGSNGQIQYYNGGSCAGSSSLTWTNASKVLTVTGNSGTAAILVPASSGYIQSDGGVYSNANVYNGFFSNTDGIVVPGFGVSTDAQTGGYFDYPQLVYPPSGSSPCYDAYGNLATFPNGLSGATFATYSAYNSGTPYAQYAIVTSGGSAYYAVTGVPAGNAPPNATYWAPMGGIIGAGLSDVIVWNGPSPLQGYVGGSPYHINGTPCNAPPLTNPLNGLNVSSYVFARYGFATDVSNATAIQVFTGGMQAESYYAGAVYYPGTVTNCCGTISTVQHLGGYMALNATTGVPGGGSGCTSIASCNNPFIPGEGLSEGMFYEESSTHHMTIYDSANWREFAYYNDNVTFGTITGVTATSTCGSLGGTGFQTDYLGAYNLIVDCNGDISVAGAGLIANNSTTGGYSAPSNSARNVYSTLGGFESTCSTGGNIVFSTSNNDFEVTCSGNATVNNITINGTCTGCSGGASYWALSGTAIYNTNNSNTGYVGINQTSPNYQLDVGGTIDSITTGSGIAFRTNNGDFEVDGQGNISLAGSGGSPYNGVVSTASATGGFNVTANSSRNSIQSYGGFESNCGTGGSQIVFSTSNNDFEIDCQGNVSVGGSGGSPYNGVFATSSATGGFNVTANTSSNSIQSVGGISLGGPCAKINGLTLTSPGCVGLVYSNTFTGVAGGSNIVAQNFYGSNLPVGMYRMTFYATESVATAGCSVQPDIALYLTWNDGTGSNTTQFASANLHPYLGVMNSGDTMFIVNGSSIPSWYGTGYAGSGCSNSGQFNIQVTLEAIS